MASQIRFSEERGQRRTVRLVRADTMATVTQITTLNHRAPSHEQESEASTDTNSSNLDSTGLT